MQTSVVYMCLTKNMGILKKKLIEILGKISKSSITMKDLHELSH